MAGNAALLEALAPLLRYPRADFEDRLAAAQALADEGRHGGLPLQAFADAVLPLSPTAREELFCHSFDLNPSCALEVGWHLFGEDYHRGQLLVRLRAELARHGLSEDGELPDYLPTVLELLAAMDDLAAAHFADACVVPALEPMTQAQRDANNPYAQVLTLVQQTVGALVPEPAEEVEHG